MQVCVKKLEILDEYLVDYCGMITHFQHLDHHLSLSHVSQRPV